MKRISGLCDSKCCIRCNTEDHGRQNTEWTTLRANRLEETQNGDLTQPTGRTDTAHRSQRTNETRHALRKNENIRVAAESHRIEGFVRRGKVALDAGTAKRHPGTRFVPTGESSKAQMEVESDGSEEHAVCKVRSTRHPRSHPPRWRGRTSVMDSGRSQVSGKGSRKTRDNWNARNNV